MLRVADGRCGHCRVSWILNTGKGGRDRYNPCYRDPNEAPSPATTFSWRWIGSTTSSSARWCAMSSLPDTSYWADEIRTSPHFIRPVSHTRPDHCSIRPDHAQVRRLVAHVQPDVTFHRCSPSVFDEPTTDGPIRLRGAATSCIGRISDPPIGGSPTPLGARTRFVGGSGTASRPTPRRSPASLGSSISSKRADGGRGSRRWSG